MNPRYETVIVSEWLARLLGVVMLLAITAASFETLSRVGLTKILFEQTYLNIDNEEFLPWLKKSLKIVEKALIKHGIGVSREDLFYELNMRVIKNENVETLLRNLENSLLQTKPTPSLHDSLKDILGNETKISQLKKFSIKGWLSKAPEKIIEIFVSVIGVIIFILQTLKT